MDALLDWLLPRFCLACAAPLSADCRRGRPAGRLGLCLRCEERLRRIDRAPACSRCAEPLTAGRICARCATEPPPWRRLHALWLYAPPLRELVHAWKFRRLDFLGRPLGLRLGSEIRSRVASLPLTVGEGGASDPGEPSSSNPPPPPLPHLPHLIVPMPLAWPRRLARGFNQTEALAAAVAAELDRPARRALRRGAALGHQTGASRRERLAGAGRLGSGRFRAAPFARLEGRVVLLVDDVLTTGATARSAALELLRAGAAAVDLAVVARTPERPETAPEPPFDTP